MKNAIGENPENEVRKTLEPHQEKDENRFPKRLIYQDVFYLMQI